MNELDDRSSDNPMDHPEEQPVDSRDGSPQFGKLLVVLACAVLMIGVLTFVAEAYYR